MRSIVYNGVDLSEWSSAEVIEKAALPVVPDTMVVPGRAGALLVSGRIPPRLVCVRLYMDAGFKPVAYGLARSEPYMTLESGVLPESVFADIADAIRGQNGLSTLYAPGDMAATILALEWDVGYKIRALLLDDGTLEINYYERRTSVTGGRIVRVFEIDPAGYSSASARSYDSIKLLVMRVYIDPTIGSLGLTNCNYWFNAFSSCTEVRGFENLSGMTSANQMFSSCTSLETIYATSFSNSGLSDSLMFTGCTRLVGGADGFVPSQTSGASVYKLGAGGVLTDPDNDARTCSTRSRGART